MSEGERVSRRDLLRRMIARIADVGGAAVDRARAAAPGLKVPYVPYTSRPDHGADGSRVEEEQA